MNAAQVHLFLNHLPIVGLFFGVALLGIGLFRKQHILAQAGLIIMLFVSIVAVPTNVSGEGAEGVLKEQVKNGNITEEQWDIMHEELHHHEEEAELGFYFLIALGVLSLLSLVLFSDNPQRNLMLRYVSLVAGLLIFVWMMKVGHSGGLIRHPEIAMLLPVLP